MEDDEPAARSLLSKFINDDTLTLSEISEKVLCMKKKQEIKQKYNDKIKMRTDGRAYVYINRKQIIASNYDTLIDKLFDMEYGRANSSLNDLFYEWMLWRRDYTPCLLYTSPSPRD